MKYGTCLLVVEMFQYDPVDINRWRCRWYYCTWFEGWQVLYFLRAIRGCGLMAADLLMWTRAHFSCAVNGKWRMSSFNWLFHPRRVARQAEKNVTNHDLCWSQMFPVFIFLCSTPPVRTHRVLRMSNSGTSSRALQLNANWKNKTS